MAASLFPILYGYVDSSRHRFSKNKEYRRAQSRKQDNNKKVSNLKSEISGSTKKITILYTVLRSWVAKDKEKTLQILNFHWVLLRNAITQDHDYK